MRDEIMDVEGEAIVLKDRKNGQVDAFVIRQIINKHRNTQQELLNGIDCFKRMGISHKVSQVKGWIKGLGEVCFDLENIEGV